MAPRALEIALQHCKDVSFPINTANRAEIVKIVQSCIGTKFVQRFGNVIVDLAIDAVQTVTIENAGRKEIDIKRYAKVEKIPGGDIEESRVLRGVMFNKDITHPKMRRHIKNARVLLLDCSLEYKKGESQTNVEISSESDWEALLKAEEEWIEKTCNDIIKFKPDVVISEKGISDLAQHYLVKHNITALRRLRKTDNNRVARATGATIVNRTDEIRDSDVGVCGLFEVQKIGDEYFTFMVDCAKPTACSIILRGANKDVLNEVERNLQDAMCVARNVLFDPQLVPGGGAIEMAVSQRLREAAGKAEGVAKWPLLAAAEAMEVIPRTLAQNCGANVIRVMTALRVGPFDALVDVAG